MQKKKYIIFSLAAFCFYILTLVFVLVWDEYGIGFFPFFMLAISVTMTLRGVVLIRRAQKHIEKVGGLVGGTLLNAFGIILVLFTIILPHCCSSWFIGL